MQTEKMLKGEKVQHLPLRGGPASDLSTTDSPFGNREVFVLYCLITDTKN